MIKDINTEEEFLNCLNEPSYLVLFYSSTCIPSNMMNVLKDKNNINIAIIDINKLPDLFNQYNIKYLPTLMLFKYGSITNKLIGLQSKESIDKLINSI
ncbi:MAG TPA: thioredoxin family protein [Bacilli bacterium]|jgi:thioredoxin-like negative regulator of GroEL|nr:thioredoxin family protein [Bacilli bacterium]HQC83631.1 thioredoxin family protein [Bacilli bacterium]